MTQYDRFPFRDFKLWVETRPTLTLDSLGITTEMARRYEEKGLDMYKADELAVKAGKHPGEIWGEWWNFPWMTDEEYEATGRKFIKEKRCKRCKKVKSRKYFGRRSSSLDGLTTECRPCTNEQSRQRKALNESSKQ